MNMLAILITAINPTFKRTTDEGHATTVFPGPNFAVVLYAGFGTPHRRSRLLRGGDFIRSSHRIRHAPAYPLCLIGDRFSCLPVVSGSSTIMYCGYFLTILVDDAGNKCLVRGRVALSEHATLLHIDVPEGSTRVGFALGRAGEHAHATV